MPSILEVYIVNSAPLYDMMFEHAGWDVIENMWAADLIVFTGGEDVSPSLYGEEALSCTYSNKERDLFEVYAYQQALHVCTPMVGICRGAQFLNVMNKGELWQDVDGHALVGEHDIWDAGTCKIMPFGVTSTHHQMMIPSQDGTVIAFATEAQIKKSPTTVWERTKYSPKAWDYEVVWYEETRCLCYQPHPEDPEAVGCREYFFKLLKKYINLT